MQVHQLPLQVSVATVEQALPLPPATRMDIPLMLPTPPVRLPMSACLIPCTSEQCLAMFPSDLQYSVVDADHAGFLQCPCLLLERQSSGGFSSTAA